MKLSIYPHEVCQSPYDIFAEMNDKENELKKAIEEQAANLYEQMTEAGLENLQNRDRHELCFYFERKSSECVQRFKVKTLAVLFSAYPREMKHIPRNLNLPPLDASFYSVVDRARYHFIA